MRSALKGGGGILVVQAAEGQRPGGQLDDRVVRRHIRHHPAARQPLHSAVELDEQVRAVQSLIEGGLGMLRHIDGLGDQGAV